MDNKRDILIKKLSSFCAKKKIPLKEMLENLDKYNLLYGLRLTYQDKKIIKNNKTVKSVKNLLNKYN